MPTYFYKARDMNGKPVQGIMEAPSAKRVVKKLRDRGYTPTKITENLYEFKVKSILDRFRKISAEDMIMFNLQLANMINAGITLLNSLNMLYKKTENSKFKEVIGDVARNVEMGNSFSESLARHPLVFSRLFVNMMKVAEATGQMDTMLTRLAEFTEQQADLREKIKGALFYPAILLCAGIVVTLFIVTFVIPQFSEIFIKSGIPLPWPTLMLYKTGMAIKSFWLWGVLFAGLTWLAFNYYIKTPVGRINFDKLKLRMPVLGGLHRKTVLARFARTLGTLAAGGVPILQSLDITREVLDNEVLASVLADVRKGVEKGEKIVDRLKTSKEFPQDMVQMIDVGEETGKLDKMLNKIADFYETAVAYAVKKLTTVLEPFFLVVMGGIIGAIMASMLLPMFDMMKILRR
ncbi:MAG: type II secretion system F family protein [Candidatus Omnitrophica bacterium]|nr:type II secretion system F family protein [Candidatus Omnitrophota bacterium]